MNKRSSSNSPFPQFEICRVSSTTKRRHSDSPTSSILKTPTAIFVTTRSSSAKRLKFANGPVDLQSLKNSSENYSESVDSAIGSPENNGEVISEDSTIEVAVSPVKTMQVSPDSWKAFLEYKKYNDYANETEKTDYTYSRLSKFRHKEIIPGFLIRPNLSRASISSVSGKSSISLPSDQSFNESFLSYDFKTENSPIDEFKYNYKTPNAVHRTSGSRSKYYLRSAGDVDSEEIDTKSHLTESQYLSDSGTEPVVKKTHMYMTGSPVLTGKSHTNYHYLTKTRSLDLDDADLDEVDDDSAIFHGINNQSNEWLEKRKMGEARMSSSASSIAKNSNFFEKISAFFLIFTMIGNKSRDLFSRYILRKGDSSSYNDLGYLSGSRYEPSYMSEKNYASPYYNSVRYYGSQKSWHQRFLSNFSEMFSKMYNFTWGSGSPYTSYNVYGHQKGTQKRKWSLWWLLIPFLILTGFGLFKMDEKYGIVTNQYKVLDCKMNGFLTSAENAMKPVLRTSYLTYKRAAASLSCYVNDSWERLKLPFAFFQDWATSKFGETFTATQVMVYGILKNLGESFRTFVDFNKNMLFYLFSLFWQFVGDFASAVANLLLYPCRIIRDACFVVGRGAMLLIDNFINLAKSSVLNLGQYLYLLFYGETYKPVKQTPKDIYQSQEQINRLSSEMADFKAIAWDLSDMKRKIEELELELQKEKDLRRSKNELYEKKLDENHMTFQHHLDTMNSALMAAKVPGQFKDSKIRYILDNHSNSLKQWIMQNFLLKTDSPPGLGENDIVLMIAKYSNKSGEDLIHLKNELKRFILKNQLELETLRKDVSSLSSTNVNGDGISVGYVKKLVGDAIKLYDADKTGKVDYALESAGGQVQSTRCTETYIASPKSYILLGWAVYTQASSPRDAITPGMAAGQCWAFVGSQGFLVLQLSHTIEVSGFTMEHISRLLVPRGHIESAPKNFSMWGLKSEYDTEPYLFGEYMYLDNDETLQYFPVQYPTSKQYNMVELKITSNHGNPNYTCLYRIRVHGDIRRLEP